MAHPDTITDAAQIAYDTVLASTGDTELADLIRHGIEDAYRTGWNRALEGAAHEHHRRVSAVRLGGRSAPRHRRLRRERQGLGDRSREVALPGLPVEAGPAVVRATAILVEPQSGRDERGGGIGGDRPDAAPPAGEPGCSGLHLLRDDFADGRRDFLWNLFNTGAELAEVNGRMEARFAAGSADDSAAIESGFRYDFRNSELSAEVRVRTTAAAS